MNETYKSLVDWYYVEEWSDYPGPKGRVVPDVEGYDDPSSYDGTELYIPQGTIGNKEGNLFIDDEGNDVPFNLEYFEKTNSLNETKMNKETLRMQMLSGIITEGEYKAKLEALKEGIKDYPKIIKKEKYVLVRGLYPSNPNTSIKIVPSNGLTLSDFDKWQTELLDIAKKGSITKKPGTSFTFSVYADENGKPTEKRVGQEGTDEPEYSFHSVSPNSLNEHFVGMGMVGNIFDREKTDYEMAFEHFTKGTSLEEGEDGKHLYGNKYVTSAGGKVEKNTTPSSRQDREAANDMARNLGLDPDAYSSLLDKDGYGPNMEGKLDENIVGDIVDKILQTFEFSQKGNDEMIEFGEYLLSPEGPKNIAMTIKSRLKGEGGEKYFTSNPEKLQAFLSKLR